MKAALAIAASLALASACGSAPAAGTGAASSTPTSASSPTPQPSPSPLPSPSPSPFTGAVGLATCPDPAPGQHPLGNPGQPGAGVHADPGLDWTGCGSVVLPLGTDRFMTPDNWQLGYATSCPDGLDYGSGGMGTSVAFSEVLPDGSAGPDTQDAPGPWTDDGGGVMAHGGNYQLKVQAIDTRCRWHVAVYPSG